MHFAKAFAPPVVQNLPFALPTRLSCVQRFERLAISTQFGFF